MKVLVYPRDDETPYQRLLYGQMRLDGAKIAYLGGLTPSQTLNLLLLPAELTARRLAGWRLVHLHWVFPFSVPGARRWRAVRLLTQAWFLVCLRVMRILGMRLVWTAHNVLPHTPVFADDAAARRALVRASDLVLAHGQSTLDALADLRAVPGRTIIVPHGPLPPAVPAASLRVPGSGTGPRRFLFFGRVEEYKGVEDLVVAFAALPAGIAATVTVAGHCADPRLRARLQELARASPARVTLRLEFIAEDDVTPLITEADIVVLPFRRVTTSGSAILALGHGRPLVIPDLAALAEIPDHAAVRYGGTVPTLTAALAHAADADASVLAAMSAAALAYSSETTWREIATRITPEMLALIGGRPVSHRPDRARGCVT